MRISRRRSADDASPQLLPEDFYRQIQPVEGRPSVHFRFGISPRYSVVLFWHLGSLLALTLTLMLGFRYSPVVLASAQEIRSSSGDSSGVVRTSRSERNLEDPMDPKFLRPSSLASISYDAWIRILSRRSEESNHIQKCLLLNEHTIKYLCEMDSWARLQKFRYTLVLPNVTEESGIYLYGLFLLDRQRWESEFDLQGSIPKSKHLRKGEYGRDCLLAEGEESGKCNRCLQRILSKLEQLEEAFHSFNASLTQFDCSLDVVTQRFSANSSCAECLVSR